MDGFFSQIHAETKRVTLALNLSQLIGFNEVEPAIQPARQLDRKVAHPTSGGVDDHTFNVAEPLPLGAQDFQFREEACRAGDLRCIKVGKF